MSGCGAWAIRSSFDHDIAQLVFIVINRALLCMSRYQDSVSESSYLRLVEWTSTVSRPWHGQLLQPMDRVHTARPVKLLAGCYTGAREDVVSSLLFIDIAVSEFDVQDSKT